MSISSTDELVKELGSTGDFPVELGSLLYEVPREQFVPARAWAGDNHMPIDREADPDAWSGAVYSNTQIITQFNDGVTEWPDVGSRPTCSNSQPSVVLGMLEALDVRNGNEVLEIGTGTGWTAAILTRMVGRDGTVTSVEIDRGLADSAQERLDQAGYRRARVVCRDGVTGVPDLAPFDRVISTMAVQLGRIPYAWVEQTRPGGTILTPVRADLSPGPLVRFTVHGDGTATGRMLPMGVAFMESRSDRSATNPADVPDWDDDSADQHETSVKPWLMLSDAVSRWAVAVGVPSCRYSVKAGRVAYFRDPLTGSWASVVPATTDGKFLVRQKGIRRLWDEVEAAYRWWIGVGKPVGPDWKWTITSNRQTIEVAPAQPD